MRGIPWYPCMVKHYVLVKHVVYRRLESHDIYIIVHTSTSSSSYQSIFDSSASLELNKANSTYRVREIAFELLA